MNDKIMKIILDTVQEYNKDLNKNDHISSDLDLPIYGGQTNLDSIGLVSFIVSLEQNLEDALNKTISLADERAMSQKNNPYASLNSLCEYINKILKSSKKYKIPAGFHSVSSDPNEAIKNIKKNYKFLAFSIDSIILQDASISSIKKIKQFIE